MPETTEIRLNAGSPSASGEPDDAKAITTAKRDTEDDSGGKNCRRHTLQPLNAATVDAFVGEDASGHTDTHGVWLNGEFT